jgi:hypothetical protein
MQAARITWCDVVLGCRFGWRRNRRQDGISMLPDFRFVIGAILALIVLGVAALGLTTAARLSHEAKVGPPEATRSVAFDERADWNQFSDPSLARRFDVLARQPEGGPATPVPDPVAATEIPQATLAVPAVEAPAAAERAASIRPDSTADAVIVKDNESVAEDAAANLMSQPPLEIEPAATIAPAPAAPEPATTGALAVKPVEPRAVITETAPAEIAPPIIEPALVDEPLLPAERAATIAAIAPNEAAPAEIERTAALPVRQSRTPTPRPKPKQAVAKRPAKVAKAKTAKAKPRRTAAQRPTAPATPAAQPFSLFGGVPFNN